MKLFLLLSEGERRTAREPFDGADHVVVDGACPKCGTHDFRVAGHGRRPSADDRAWEADASCYACRARVGTIRLETNTLFGVREDEAVLKGRVRVY